MNNISELMEFRAKLDSIEDKLDRLLAERNSKVTVEDIKITTNDSLVEQMKTALNGLNTGYPLNRSIA